MAFKQGGEGEMNKKGTLLGDIALVVVGFLAGSYFGPMIIEIIKGWLKI